jgi:hypothetical protein
MRPPSEKKVDCGGDKTYKKQIDFDKVEKVFVVNSSLSTRSGGEIIFGGFINLIIFREIGNQ